MRTTRLCLAFAAALMPGFGLAESPPADDAAFDADAWEVRHARAERELFDLLRADTSPRMQVLAGRVHLSDEDAENPLRPKDEDVVARAANLARGDAFVQSVAASEGNYRNSQCGPVRWPEAEVANLVRLEPDNAAAWRYAVALALAKGDQAGIDAALERMAASRRADDHEGEEVALWTQVFSAHPDAAVSPYDSGNEMAVPAQTALSAALDRVSFRYSMADAALTRACQPDGSTEQDWRRLDWCARAGLVLAREGDSFALRELGLKLLGKGDGHADLQRQQEWLKANASDPSRSASAFSDAAEDRERDWKDVSGSIAAAERRLARLGKSATPPEGWTADDAYDENDAAEAADAWLAYLRKVLDAMRASGDAREQALAVIANRMFESAESAPGVEASDGGKDDERTIADIAAAQPDDLLVQWIAAHHGDDDARATATVHLQRLDPTNAATWALSLPASGDKADPLPTLQRMAASRHHDEYAAGFIGIWSTAFSRVPVPEDLMMQFRSMGGKFDAKSLPNVMALSSMFHLTMSAASPNLLTACTPEVVAARPERRGHCLATGRLLLQQGRTLLAARFGEALLRKLDALQGADATRSRQIAWWQAKGLPGADSTAIDAYFEDWLSTGNEVEAMRLAATRAGQAEPPADWQPQKHTRM